MGRLCPLLLSLILGEVSPARAQLPDPTEKLTRVLSKARRIYVAALGATTCSSWDVRPSARGSAVISTRDESGDLVSYFVEVASARNPGGDGQLPVLIRLGPTVTPKRKDVLAGAISWGEQLWLGRATSQYVEVEGERWFFDRVTCSRTIAKERLRKNQLVPVSH
ncbi:MAG TPA: hypothetical protein VFF06_17475 [Polyangia bacterium]|nr:hypothetical protein [Polyangia bacterium]